MTSETNRAAGDLLPCPFCGSKHTKTVASELDERCGYNIITRVECNDCGVSKGVRSEADKNGWCTESAESAIRRAHIDWNTRAAPAEDVRAMVDEPVAWMFKNDNNRIERIIWWEPQEDEAPSFWPTPIPLFQRKKVMPDRIDQHDPWGSGWNACLDEFKRLNGDQP